MNIVRSVSSWLCLYLVGTCFFITANAYVLIKVVNADTIKAALKEQGTYAKVVPAVLSTAEYSGATAGTLPLNEPWVKDVVNKAFTPQDVEKQFDTIIDSTFTWLDGTTAQPEFTVDLTSNKQRLADETGNYVQNRLANLPPCTLRNLPSTVDPYRIDCLPPGVSPSVVGKSVSNDIFNDQNFLKNPVVSSKATDATNLSTLTGTPQSTNTINADGLRSAYQRRNTSLWLFPLLTLLLAGAGFILAIDKRKAVARLSHSFFFTALGLGIFAVFMTIGTQTVVALAAKDTLTHDVIGPVITELMRQARTIYLLFAVVALVVSSGLFVAKRKMLSTSRIV